MVHLNAAANVCASQLQAKDSFLFSIVELEGLTKQLMTGPSGNTEFASGKN